jgi:hypothetical protein
LGSIPEDMGDHPPKGSGGWLGDSEGRFMNNVLSLQGAYDAARHRREVP